VNRSEVIAKAAEEAGVDAAVVEKVVTTFFEIISETLSNGDPVNVRRFGKFEPRLRRAMTKPNPRSGEPMEIPERLSVVFLPSEILKGRLNGEAES
jgi:nucleoid DNA-binding protein